MFGARSALRRLGYAGGRSKHTLPDLPYDYKALEPIISADIMHVHHDKHHAAYVNNLNAAEEKMSEALAKSDLLEAIKKDFGSFESLKSIMSARAVGVQGSGWAWLGYNPKTQRLQVANTFNQDSLIDTEGLVPLFTIDVWEHAYYLQYKNVRPDYVKAIWDIANWENVAERLHKARSQ
ncbi:hypothetical protein MRX96_010951 [Rhipicephalus microplus]